MSSTIKQAIQALKSRIESAYVAVEAKGGTLPVTQDTANLPAAIASIPSGGGTIEPEEKDVLFIDYDGTIIASYTYEEFESVTDYPTPPTHDGLTFYGWTNTLQELKTYKKKITLSGALYYPSDNTTGHYVTHIFIETFAPNQEFGFATRANGGSMDWGDGSEIESNLAATKTHIYASAGKYHIKHICVSVEGTGINIQNSAHAQLVTDIWFSTVPYGSNIAGVAGDNLRGVWLCSNLKTIVVPKNNALSRGNDTFAGCSSLKAIVGTNLGGVHRAYSSTNIKYLTKWFDAVNIDWGNYNRRLRRINFIISPTSGYAGTNNFQNNTCLQYIWLNQNAGMASMSNCYSCREIHIPHTSVPSLANTNYFTNIPTTCKIYVKTGLLSQYETATNWSTIYAQYQFIEED